MPQLSVDPFDRRKGLDVFAMKALLVNSDDGTGGAARAAMRLYLGLRALDVETNLLVGKKQTMCNFIKKLLNAHST